MILEKNLAPRTFAYLIYFALEDQKFRRAWYLLHEAGPLKPTPWVSTVE